MRSDQCCGAKLILGIIPPAFVDASDSNGRCFFKQPRVQINLVCKPNDIVPLSICCFGDGENCFIG